MRRQRAPAVKQYRRSPGGEKERKPMVLTGVKGRFARKALPAAVATAPCPLQLAGPEAVRLPGMARFTVVTLQPCKRTRLRARLRSSKSFKTGFIRFSTGWVGIYPNLFRDGH